MTLYFIGLGLNDEKDISLKGLEIVRECDRVYLENYTSKLNCSVKKLEKLYGKRVILADRALVEEKTRLILDEAKQKEVAFLVIGAPTAATTHINLVLEAKKRKIPYQIVENASVYSAIGITGLFLYKFGKTTTIPFENKDIKSPYQAFLNNQKLGLHTLFLLDIKKDRLMTINEGLNYLIRMGLNKNKLVIGCSALGSKKPEIRVGKIKDISKEQFNKFPQCLIMPGKLHFIEKDFLETLKNN